MKKCRQCGKELPNAWSTDICLDCSRQNVRKIFKQNPDVKQAFMESVEKMRKQENIKKMADDTVNFMKAVQEIQRN